MTPQQRSNLMSRVRQRGTDIELQVSRALRLRGVRFRCNVRTLAGSPDLVFTKPPWRCSSMGISGTDIVTRAGLTSCSLFGKLKSKQTAGEISGIFAA